MAEACFLAADEPMMSEKLLPPAPSKGNRQSPSKSVHWSSTVSEWPFPHSKNFLTSSLRGDDCDRSPTVFWFAFELRGSRSLSEAQLFPRAPGSRRLEFGLATRLRG